MKKLSKNAISVLLVCLLFISICPVYVAAYDSGVYNGLCYDVINNEVIISGYSQELAQDVIIPEEINGYAVSKIEYGAFDSAEIKTIHIPETVKEIGVNNSTDEVIIPSFYNCSELKKIVVDSNNTNYSTDEYGVLFNKDKSVLYHYPAGSDESTYSVPECVSAIGNVAFEGANNLSEINIPDKVITIQNDSFKNTAYYNNPDNWIDGVLYIGNHLIAADDSIEACIIKDDTLTIAPSAFAYNSNLEKVIFPESLLYVGENAFLMTSIKEAILPNIKSISESTFGGCNRLEKIEFESVEKIEQSAFAGCSALISVKIPSVKEIGSMAFFYCESLNTIELPVTLKKINTMAFANSALNSITIPDNVVSVGNGAFMWCKNLTNVHIGNGIEIISSNMFAFCPLLKDVELSNSINYIDESAFAYCTSLNEINLSENINLIEKCAFFACDNLKNVYINNPDTTIKDYALGVVSDSFTDEQNEELIYILMSKLYGFPVETDLEEIINSCDDSIYSKYMTICGYKNSTAELYANKNGIKFVTFDFDSDDSAEDEGKFSFSDFINRIIDIIKKIISFIKNLFTNY